MGIVRVIKVWRVAKRLQDAVDSGQTLIAVPKWLDPELRQIIWERKVTRAAEKWEQRVAEVPLADWQIEVRRAFDATREESNQDQAENGTA